PARAVTHIALVRLRSQSTCSRSVRLPIAFTRAGRSQENERSPLASGPQQSKHPRSAATARRLTKWNARNWQAVRRPSRPKPSIGDCPGARPSASLRQRSSYAVTAALTTWLRASSSDAIGDAESVSANGMDRRHLRKSREARSSTKGCDEGSGALTLGPFFLSRYSLRCCPVPRPAGERSICGSQGKSPRRSLGNEAPKHLLRDRDNAFGTAYTRRIRAMGASAIIRLRRA